MPKFRIEVVRSVNESYIVDVPTREDAEHIATSNKKLKDLTIIPLITHTITQQFESLEIKLFSNK